MSEINKTFLTQNLISLWNLLWQLPSVTTSPNLSYLHDNHWAELSCFRYKSFQIHATSNKHCIFLKDTEHVFQGQKISSAKCGLRKCCSRCKLISFISHRVIIHLVSTRCTLLKEQYQDVTTFQAAYADPRSLIYHALTVFGYAGASVRLQAVPICTAAAIWPIGVHAGLAACPVHAAFIMICTQRKSHLWQIRCAQTWPKYIKST